MRFSAANVRRLATALLGAVLFASTASASREDHKHAGSSSISRENNIAMAKFWAALAPGRSWANITPTGSMLPTADSHSIFLLETVTAAQLKVGDIALYARGDVLMAHRVVEVRSDGIYFDGDNNQWPDGWIAPDRIRFRVAGILYSAR